MGIPKFAHIVLQTGQKSAMRDWYCTTLGAHVVFENDLLCFITFDEEHHRVALIQPPPGCEPRSPRAAGLNHSAFTFASLDELLERYTLLKSKGIEPRQPIQHGVTTSLYYRDPDGNFVEMQVDNFATPDDATGYMRGPEYAADAVGVGFDPEKMLAAHKAGVPFEVLKTRRWALEACPNMPDPIIALTS
jgi:catechol-2,3-dioxygenase